MEVKNYTTTISLLAHGERLDTEEFIPELLSGDDDIPANDGGGRKMEEFLKLTLAL